MRREIKIKVMDEDKNKSTKESEGISSPRKATSMSTLIVWNIAKVLEKKPYIDLKKAIKGTQERLDVDSRDVSTIISQYSEDRHIACALLAWKQLGHSDADSLYQFIEEKRKSNELLSKKETPVCMTTDHKESESPTDLYCSIFDSNLMGPVVKLPVEPKTVMRLDYSQNSRPLPRKLKEQEKDLTNKIETACCLDSDCVERLAELDSMTKELRSRAGKLARREAERVELLERAEAAWKDLESGFQRRLTLSQEKEEDMTKQIQKLIEDRNEFKNTCLLMVEKLKNKSDAAEKDRDILKKHENELCNRACTRLHLSEECARAESTLAEEQCKVALLERDLQFKEEQTSRKASTLEGEVESARTLTHEAERALRAELGAIKEQITQISIQLLDEDSKTSAIKAELEDLREEKMDLVEDLDSCKVLCDGRMQGKLDELMKKRETLSELKDKVMECRCKLPVDAAVQVKRTPSLAALCRCAPEDKLLDSCSCSSLRSQLLSNLLADLFGGLQSELGTNGSQMPCKLLKCLEDNHNWDRASIVKSNLRSYFSQLLIGELDIAIATSIENYHAKWVGASCADVAKLTPSLGEREDEGWQERALERRAQKLATKLAEQLFQEKAEQLAQEAKDIISSVPPCECKPQSAVFQCLVNPPTIGGGIASNDKGTPAYWRRTQQDVTQLRVQIEDLKKASIKKEDLKSMEEKITKIFQRTSRPDSMKPEVPFEHFNRTEEKSKKEYKTHKVLNAEQDSKNTVNDKQNIIKRKQIEKYNSQKKSNKSTSNQNESIEKSSKSYKRHGQSFAVNVCLCSQRDPKKIEQQTNKVNNKQNILNNERKLFWKQKSSINEIPQISSIKQTKPITSGLPSEEINNLDNNKSSVEPLCTSNCACFNKIPSNTSIDNLLDTLTKWNCDLIESRESKSIKKDKVASKICLKDCNVLKHIDSLKKNSHMMYEDLKKSKTSLKKKIVSEVFFDSYNQIEGELSKSTEVEPILASRDSVYMGAINLDKSNENFCKCIENIEIHNKNELDENYDPKCLYKSVNLDACNCTNIKQDQVIEHSNTQNKNDFLLDAVSKNFENKPYLEINNTNVKSHEKIDEDVNQTEIKKVIQTEFFPCDCDYYIKFLGVTLSNTTSDKILKGYDENDISSHVKNVYKNKSSNLQPKNKITFECNSYNKQRGDYIIHEDKALDIQSFKDISEKKECICCEVDESRDLELNTFHLLEEHLKGKLEKFKQSTCKSSCISPDEEKKLFSSIFQKVKHVVTENTNTFTCRCSEGMESDGSWKRAYGLLQEYLKIKIKRVQCLCVSSKESKDVILPDILDKVCTMIEKDFKRLQSICTCNTNGEVVKSLCIENKTSLQDLDTNLVNFVYEPNIPQMSKYNTNDKIDDKLSKQISNSIMDTQNISSQVSQNLGMATKSCDAIKKGAKHVQTIDASLKKYVKSSQYSQLKHDTCHCYSSVRNKRIEVLENLNISTNYCTDLPNKKECFGPKINTRKSNKKSSSCPVFNDFEYNTPISVIEQCNNEKGEKAKKLHIDDSKKQSEDTKNNLPYVGYTINCSCDSKLGACICTKSIVMTENIKIDSIWKALMADGTRSCDVSYVMNGSKKPVDENNENFCTHNKYCINKNSACETETCTLSKEGLVLKDSLKKVSTTHDTTNTFDEGLSIGTDYYYNEDPIDWFNCGSQIHKNSTKVQNNGLESSYLPTSINDHKRQTKSEILMNSNEIKSKNISSNCDCNMVPLCHVKMLVENIENKLIHSQCTCDSLSSKVCPVHSKAIS